MVISMEEIWNRIIQGQSGVRYRQSEFFSPYCESVVGSIRKQQDGTDCITMNTFYRYDDIFIPLFARDDIEESTRDWLLDCMMHLLARLELRNGADRHEYELRVIQKELLTGKYGARIKALFEKLSDDSQYMAAHMIRQQEQCGESIDLFARALTSITKDGVVYKSEVNPKELLLYMGKVKNEQNEIEIAFAEEAYMPFGYSLRVFWDHSFGIMEDDRCMQIGRIEIF